MPAASGFTTAPNARTEPLPESAQPYEYGERAAACVSSSSKAHSHSAAIAAVAPVILSAAKDLKMRRLAISRSFAVFAAQDDGGARSHRRHRVQKLRVAARLLQLLDQQLHRLHRRQQPGDLAQDPHAVEL